MVRKWDIRSEQVKQQCIDEVITRLNELSENEVGMLAAQDIIDIVAARLGPEVYNHALEDAKKIIEKKLADLEVDIDVLRVLE